MWKVPVGWHPEAPRTIWGFRGEGLGLEGPGLGSHYDSSRA